MTYDQFTNTPPTPSHTSQNSRGISDRVRAGGDGDLLTRHHVVAAQHPRVALVIGLVL